MPRFSIIIPTYNRKDLLKRAIESVINQNFKDYEIIVVNDGGENLEDIINNFNNEKIMLIQYAVNKGLPYAKNLGIKYAKSEWIIFLDDDDEIIKNSLGKLDECIKKGLWYVAPRLYLFENKEFIFPPYQKLIYLSKKPIKSLDIRKFPFGGSILNRKIFEKFYFDEEIFYGEDYEFYFRLVKSNIKFKPINVVYYKYYFRIYEKNFDKVLKDREYILNKHLNNFDKENLSIFYFHLSKISKKSGKLSKVLKYIYKGLITKPSSNSFINVLFYLFLLILPRKWIIFLEKQFAKTGLRFLLF
jgi:glycosyltransferase involved in cell wall biosynthesis